MPPASPKGQLPYIVDEAESVADSTFIRAHIEGKYGFDFDAPLSLQARAQAWAFERMIEHHVYWALVGARWVDAENFARGAGAFLRCGARASARKTSRRRAIPRCRELPAERSRPPRPGRGYRSRRPLVVCAVGPARDKPYLMGETPCGTDATAFGALAGILTPFFASPLRERAEEFQNLTAYVDRMMLRYYPDFAWAPLRQAA